MTEVASTRVAAGETHVLIIGAGSCGPFPFSRCNYKFSGVTCSLIAHGLKKICELFTALFRS
jgi:hypothetical protein